MGLEFVALNIDRFLELTPLFCRVSGVVAKIRKIGDRLGGRQPRFKPPRLVEGLPLDQARDGTIHGLLGNWLALGVVGRQKRRRCVTFQYVGEFPGDVVRVLHRDIGTKSVVRRMPVYRIADAKTPAGRDLLRVNVVYW